MWYPLLCAHNSRRRSCRRLIPNLHNLCRITPRRHSFHWWISLWHNLHRRISLRNNFHRRIPRRLKKSRCIASGATIEFFWKSKLKNSFQYRKNSRKSSNLGIFMTIRLKLFEKMLMETFYHFRSIVYIFFPKLAYFENFRKHDYA